MIDPDLDATGESRLDRDQRLEIEAAIVTGVVREAIEGVVRGVEKNHFNESGEFHCSVVIISCLYLNLVF